ncbi:MAG: sulfite exporter TauE/SafE family protein [Deltaproteobacteria bacterium]|nr:sulfite exporter TauE/SafE family protein [Deltaproteobacteria bacterium]
MEQLAAAWYGWLSQLSAGLIRPVEALVLPLNVPALSVLAFGVLGALAPCQLTTGAAALAYVSRGGPGILRRTAAYVGGRTVMYLTAAGAVLLVGWDVRDAAIPVITATRKALGPLMVFIGLGFLDVIRLPGGFGTELAGRLQAHLPAQGALGAFLLGVVFSLAFCPTLFWLFFGLTLPLALSQPAGWLLPGVFALGTGLPLLALTGLMPRRLSLVAHAGTGAWNAGPTLGGLLRWGRLGQKLAGLVFVIAGLHDTFTYWWL